MNHLLMIEDSKPGAPAGGVEIATGHYLELRAWRVPGGSRYVQLIDESEETWETYCRLLAKRSRERCQRQKEIAA